MSGMRVEVKESLTVAEVANMFRVDPKTVARWAAAGKIPEDAWFRTLGGHRRFYADVIERLRDQS